MSKNGAFTANTSIDSIEVGDTIAISGDYDHFETGVVVSKGANYLVTDDFVIGSGDLKDGMIIMKYEESSDE
jgi:hypothetical protein